MWPARSSAWFARSPQASRVSSSHSFGFVAVLFLAPPFSGAAGPAPTSSRDDPVPGWKPKRHEGAWAAIYKGDTSTLPAELVGLPIVVTRSSGDSWIATVLEVVERSDRHVLVRRTDPPATS